MVMINDIIATITKREDKKSLNLFVSKKIKLYSMCFANSRKTARKTPSKCM